jgi:hypothetical protein
LPVCFEIELQRQARWKHERALLQPFAHSASEAARRCCYRSSFCGSISVGATVGSLIRHEEIIMRLIPILAAVTIGLFATAVAAQTKDPGSAPPGVPQDGPGKAVPVKPADVKKMDTTPPSSTPAAAEKTSKKAAKKHVKKQSM